jgi:hypothetical protein
MSSHSKSIPKGSLYGTFTGLLAGFPLGSLLKKCHPNKRATNIDKPMDKTSEGVIWSWTWVEDFAY